MFYVYVKWWEKKISPKRVNLGVGQVKCKILECSLRILMRAILEEPLPNISLFIFIWDQRCLPQVRVVPSLLILMILYLCQVMRRYWRIWTKRTWLFFIAWWLFPILMIFSIHMRFKRGRAIMDPIVGVWNVSITMWATPHLFMTLTNFTLVEFDEFTYLSVPIIPTHAWSTSEVLISSLEIRFRVWFFFVFNFSFQG